VKAWCVLFMALFSAGAMAAQPPAPIQALQRKGLTIQGEMQAPPGFRGYLAEFQGQRLPVYLLPDGKHVVVGNLFDADGHDLTRGPFAAAVKPKLGPGAWKALAASTWIAEGAAHPRRVVYVFSDTECPYCHRLWQKVQPLLAGGTVQVRYVMVAVIRPESLGRAAAILSAADPAKAMRRHEKDFGHSPIRPMAHVPAAMMKKIEDNNRLMDQFGISGTPAILFRDPDGNLQRLDGMPDKPAYIKAIFGS
jgi:thiol:disulfide interchange protein DsbG